MEKIFRDFQAAEAAVAAGDWGAAMAFASLLPFLGKEFDSFAPSLYRLVWAVAVGDECAEMRGNYDDAHASASALLERLRPLC